MKKLGVAAFLAVGLPLSAMAAPYCLAIPGGTPICQYYDGPQCQADAQRQNGSCEPNPAEVQVPTSQFGQYCMLLPVGYSHCGYADGGACARDALREHGVCARSPNAGPTQIPDPYYPNAGR